jgi:hypothetical protein
MPATVNVNKVTVVHAGSTGVSTAFPDVCKTPSPAGPIPIPYPNVAQSSDTADGSTTVKVDGNPIMLKGSNFRMSTGDEAGSAMNVVSNKIKGKAEPLLYSMNVKADGKNVFRLKDLMFQNCGSPTGTPPANEVQAPLPEGTFTSEACTKVRNKREEQGEKIASKNSGMHPDHFAKIKDVAKEFNVVFYFRQTEAVCMPWIDEKHQPKPHRVFKANTITPGATVEEVAAWLKRHEENLRWGTLAVTIPISAGVDLLHSNHVYSSVADDFLGVVGEPAGKNEEGQEMRKPLQAVGTGPQLSGRSYKNKWITADYDLYQVLRAVEGCKELDQKSRAFSKIKRAINKECEWDAIQHGPQAQWVPTAHEKKAHGAPDINLPAEVKGALKSGDAAKTVTIPKRTKPMKIIDDNVTVIAPEGVVFLEKQEDTFEALKCRKCDE